MNTREVWSLLRLNLTMPLGIIYRRNLEDFREVGLRKESPLSRVLWELLLECQTAGVPMGLRTVNGSLLKFQMGMKLYLKLEDSNADCILAKDLPKFCQCPESLHGIEFKGERLVPMVKEIL